MKKIKTILGLEFVKVSSLTAISTIVRIAAQFLSAKILAVLLQAKGLALLGQLTNVSSLAMLVSTGAITVGVTKYVAEHQQSTEEQKKITQSAFTLIAICSIIISLIFLIAARPFCYWFFKNYEYVTVFYILGATVGMYALHTFWVALLNGYGQVKKIVFINIITSVASVLLSLLLAWWLNVEGAMIAFVLGQTAVCGITWLFVKKEVWFKESFRFLVDKKIFKALGIFTIMSLFAGFLGPVSQLIIRNMLTQNFSLDVAGYWEAMNRISANYLLFFTSTIAVYYLPKLASLKSKDGLIAEIKTVYKLVVPVLAIASIVIYFFREPLIHILFSSDFLPMERLFGWQIAGDFLKISSWILGYLMWAKGYVKEFVITETLFAVMLVSLTYLCITKLGFHGVAIAYCINYCLYFIIIYILMRIKINNQQPELINGQY